MSENCPKSLIYKCDQISNAVKIDPKAHKNSASKLFELGFFMRHFWVVLKHCGWSPTLLLSCADFLAFFQLLR